MAISTNLKNVDTKKKNFRYEVVSNAKELLTKHYKKFYEEEKKTYNDMYEEIGLYCGISPSTVSQIRLKNLAPSYIVSVKLSELLGVNPTDIWQVVEIEDFKEEDQQQCKILDCTRISTTRGYCMKHAHFGKAEIDR